MKKITVHITDSQHKLIREEAKRRGIKMAELLRSVLFDWEKTVRQEEEEKGK